MTVSLEKIFFNYLLENKKYYHVILPHYFKNSEIQFVYNVIRKYILSDTDVKTPSPKQILEMVSLEDIDKVITKDILKTILKEDLSKYDEQKFIVPRLNAWILSNKLKGGSSDIIDETRNLDNILDLDSVILSANKIKGLVDEMTSMKYFSDTDDLGTDFDDPEEHVQDSSLLKVRTGYETLDHILGGGWDKCTLNMLMGETNSGKCGIDFYLYIKNRKTGEIEKVMVQDFFDKIKKSKCGQ